MTFNVAADAYDAFMGRYSKDTHRTFEDWWLPFSGGVGPAGAHAKALAPEARDALARSIRATLPPAPFTINARAWAARGRVGSIP